MSDYTRPGMPKSDPSLLRLQLVGPMQAWTLDNESVLPPGRKTRGLLAILAMSGRRPVLRSKLAEMLWSRRSEEQARASLRQEIHRLLDALTPIGASIVSVERHALALRPGLTAVDAERLLNANVNHVLSQASANTQPGSGSGFALPALDGVLLEELNGTDPALDVWLVSERRRLHDHALGLFEAALQRGPAPVATIAICRQLLLLDPLHETAWRELIRAQLLQGDRGAALQTGDRCAALFSRRASGQPGPETSRLLGELRNGGIPTQPYGGPPAADGIDTGRESAGGMEAGTAPDQQPGSAAPAGVGPSTAAEMAASEDAVVSVAGHRLHGRSIATLAVLPPLDLDAGVNDKLVPALTEELVAGLAMHPLLAVISGSALAATLALGRDDPLLRRSFGLDYVLDGTILRGRGRIRIILRLLDLRLQGYVVWAKRFDCDPADAMARLDDVANMVSAQLPWELLVIESRRIGSRPAAELSAIQLSLRALHLVMRPERTQNDKAGELLIRAKALDPDHPLTAMIDGMRHVVRAMQFWGSNASEGRLAEAATHQALNTGHVASPVIAIAGLIRGRLLDDAKSGLALIEHSLELNPTMSMGHVFAAFVLVRMGRLDEAEQQFGLYKQLSPLHPMHYMFDGIAVTIALLQGRTEAAADLGRVLIELSPALLYPAIPCLAAFGYLGLHDECERLLGRIQGLSPGLSIERVLAHMELQRALDRDCLAGGLAAAGMPESHGQDHEEGAAPDKAPHSAPDSAPDSARDEAIDRAAADRPADLHARLAT